MDFISAPNLRAFHEGCSTDTPSTSFPSVVEYGSSFRNERGARAYRMEWQDLKALQRRFPNLQRLILEERPELVASVLEHLAAHPDIWPHLQSLEGQAIDDAQIEQFSELLAKRNPNANTPIATSWSRLGDRPKYSVRLASVSILLSLYRMNTHNSFRWPISMMIDHRLRVEINRNTCFPNHPTVV